MSAPTESPHRHLPTDEEIVEAEKLLQAAYNEFESLTWATKGYSRLYEHEAVIPDVIPTQADVGRLYLFAHYLEGRADDFNKMAREMVDALPLLGEMAPNIEIRRQLETS